MIVHIVKQNLFIIQHQELGAVYKQFATLFFIHNYIVDNNGLGNA